MQTRRGVVGLCAGSVLAALSGCIGFLTGDEAYEAAAEPALVREATVDDTDYDLDELREAPVEEQFEVAGQERTVKATNWVGTYEKRLDHPLLGETNTGVFAVLSSPAFEIAGRTLNPIGEHDDAELAEMLASEYDDLTIRNEVETLSYVIFDSAVEVTKLDATATVQGQDVEVYVQVGSLQHEDDFVIPLSVYPQALADDEEPVVAELAEAIEHPADA